MTTLHIYLSNCGSRLILQSPLVQAAEQWREFARYTAPVVLLTHCKIGELDCEAQNYLALPFGSTDAAALISFLNQRGGSILPRAGFEKLTLTNMSLTVPWIESENPESVGRGSERGGVIEIVEFQPYGFLYLHIDSKLVRTVAQWKWASSYNAIVFLWTSLDIDEEHPRPFVRILAPLDRQHSAALLEHLQQIKAYADTVAIALNPGHYADPWGCIDQITCLLRPLSDSALSIQEEQQADSFAQSGENARRRRNVATIDDPASL